MSNRRKMLVGIAGFLVILIGGSFFIWSRKATRAAQPPAEKAVAGADSQVGAADLQRQVNYQIRMGDKMMDDGDYGSARSYYEAALKLAPSNTVARAGIENAKQALAGDSTKDGTN